MQLLSNVTSLKDMTWILTNNLAMLPCNMAVPWSREDRGPKVSFQSLLISVRESLSRFVSFLLEEKEEKHKMPSSTLSSQLGRHFLSVETLSRPTPLEPQC